MNGANVLTKFTADTKDFDKKLNGVSKGIGNLTGSFVKGSLITSGLGKAFNLVSQNMDSAIDRFDTLNNFPKVMKNLGIATKDSQKAIDKMSEKLVGLPTTLDQGAMAVQRFTSKNGDVKKSADMFLAVNNAILAGGAPAVNQASALEQLTQAYSRGKFELNEWKSLQIAMPAQLKQVANAMGYVSDSDLYEALKKDEVSMDDFINTIMRLNTEGSGGLESFKKQAKGTTDGIRTALTNFNSRIAQGLTKMIESVNQGLAKAGMGNIAQVFSNAGNQIKNVLIALAPYITKFIVLMGNAFNFIRNHATLFKTLGLTILTFVGYLKIVTTTISAMRGIITVITLLVNMFKVVKTVITAVRMAMILLNLAFILNPIGVVVLAVAGLVAGFVVLWKKSEAFRNFWINMWEHIKTAFTVIINSLKSVFTALVNHYMQKFYTIKNIVTNIVNAFKSIPSKMTSIGKNIMQGLWKGMSGLKSWAIDKVKGMGKSILKGLKNALGIHSPSTEFALVGKFSVLGFTQQLDKMKSKIQEQVNDTFGISPQFASSSSLNYSPNVITNVTINQTQDPLGRMVNKIKTQSGGAKNDYNYGQGVA